MKPRLFDEIVTITNDEATNIVRLLAKDESLPVGIFVGGRSVAALKVASQGKRRQTRRGVGLRRMLPDKYSVDALRNRALLIPTSALAVQNPDPSRDVEATRDRPAAAKSNLQLAMSAIRLDAP